VKLKTRVFENLSLMIAAARPAVLPGPDGRRSALTVPTDAAATLQSALLRLLKHSIFISGSKIQRFTSAAIIKIWYIAK
jgi:hypothetical protein